MQCYTWEDNDLQNSWQYPIFFIRLDLQVYFWITQCIHCDFWGQWRHWWSLIRILWYTHDEVSDTRSEAPLLILIRIDPDQTQEAEVSADTSLVSLHTSVSGVISSQWRDTWHWSPAADCHQDRPRHRQRPRTLELGSAQVWPDWGGGAQTWLSPAEQSHHGHHRVLIQTDLFWLIGKLAKINSSRW